MNAILKLQVRSHIVSAIGIGGRSLVLNFSLKSVSRLTCPKLPHWMVQPSPEPTPQPERMLGTQRIKNHRLLRGTVYLFIVATIS